MPCNSAAELEESQTEITKETPKYYSSMANSGPELPSQITHWVLMQPKSAGGSSLEEPPSPAPAGEAQALPLHCRAGPAASARTRGELSVQPAVIATQ